MVRRWRGVTILSSAGCDCNNGSLESRTEEVSPVTQCETGASMENICRDSNSRRRKKAENEICGRGTTWPRVLFTITGVFAIIWVLVRVIPKPSRASYPCQRVAVPLAFSFITYVLGTMATALAVRKVKQSFMKARYFSSVLFLLAALSAAWLMNGLNWENAGAEYISPDPPNEPIGVAKGSYPGRVSWVHAPESTNWDPAWDDRTDIFYWDDDHTSQA